MTAITLESLGLSKEQLQEMLLERMVEQAMVGVNYDDEGNEYRTDTSFSGQLKKRVQEQINASIATLAEQHVLPNVAQYIENMTLQATTAWGEKQGKPVTFIEYLVQRADAYMREEVNYEGKSKKDSDSYNWSGKTTRIVYLIEKHLHYRIEQSMKEMLGVSQATVAKAIEEAVRLQLANIVTAFKASVEVKGK